MSTQNANPTSELEGAMDEVLTRLAASDTFKSRLRQLVRNAIGNNLADDSDVRNVLSVAPSDYDEEA